jgi:hypothetical protein
MIFVIVPCYEREHLSSFIECLNKQHVKPFVLFINSGGIEKDFFYKYKYDYSVIYPYSRTYAYWSQCIELGVRRASWKMSNGDIVGIMNHDQTFGEDYFEIVEEICSPGHIVSSCIYDSHNSFIEAGIKMCWDKVFTTKLGIIPAQAMPTNQNVNCFTNRGIFLSAVDVHKIKLHTGLLPHYQSDYAWTYKAIKEGMIPIVPDYLCVFIDAQNTGIKPKRLSEFFSIEYSENPIYLISYIVLCCPALYIIPNILRVFLYTLINMWRTVECGKVLNPIYKRIGVFRYCVKCGCRMEKCETPDGYIFHVCHNCGGVE